LALAGRVQEKKRSGGEAKPEGVSVVGMRLVWGREPTQTEEEKIESQNLDLTKKTLLGHMRRNRFSAPRPRAQDTGLKMPDGGLEVELKQSQLVKLKGNEYSKTT